jgi:hypothetical protein
MEQPMTGLHCCSPKPFMLPCFGTRHCKHQTLQRGTSDKDTDTEPETLLAACSQSQQHVTADAAAAAECSGVEVRMVEQVAQLAPVLNPAGEAWRCTAQLLCTLTLDQVTPAQHSTAHSLNETSLRHSWQ